MSVKIIHFHGNAFQHVQYVASILSRPQGVDSLPLEYAAIIKTKIRFLNSYYRWIS